MIMHRVKDAVQIDVGHLKPLFWRKLVNVLFRTDDSGIIERKMQSAERLFGKIDGRFCIIGIGTFALKGAAFPPFCFNSSAKAVALSRSISAMTTAAPPSTSSLTISAPMLEAPPETVATLPSKLYDMSFSLLLNFTTCCIPLSSLSKLGHFGKERKSTGEFYPVRGNSVCGR